MCESVCERDDTGGFHDRFQAQKVLGEGGQGKVCLGVYDGFKCAGKTFTGTPDQDLVVEVQNEINFFMKLDHPNCHYLLGAKTTLDDGGIIVLTEVCDQGSLFDLYYTKQVPRETRPVRRGMPRRVEQGWCPEGFPQGG